MEPQLVERLGRPAAMLITLEKRLSRRSFLKAAGASVALASISSGCSLAPIETGQVTPTQEPSTAGRVTLNIVAHEDDDLLFLSPDLLHDIQSGRQVRTIYMTSGDAGRDTNYWKNRQVGEMAAYAQMSGVANAWNQTDAGIAEHPIPVYTLAQYPSVSIAFMHLPDGNGDGAGFPSDRQESLQKLWQGKISTIHTVDGSSSYTKESLISTLTALMVSFQPDHIRTQDYVGKYGDGDHSDHHTVAYLVQAAQHQYTNAHILIAYKDYGTASLPENVTGADLVAKQNAFYAYGQYNWAVCHSASSCTGTTYAKWLGRQYTVSKVAFQ
jgi:LmbE family N-acetylglucosaminyl deacetylase